MGALHVDISAAWLPSLVYEYEITGRAERLPSGDRDDFAMRETAWKGIKEALHLRFDDTKVEATHAGVLLELLRLSALSAQHVIQRGCHVTARDRIGRAECSTADRRSSTYGQRSWCRSLDGLRFLMWRLSNSRWSIQVVGW